MAELRRGHRQQSAGAVSTVRFAELEKKGNAKDEKPGGKTSVVYNPAGLFASVQAEIK